jgi:hypothetical protein
MSTAATTSSTDRRTVTEVCMRIACLLRTGASKIRRTPVEMIAVEAHVRVAGPRELHGGPVRRRLDPGYRRSETSVVRREGGSQRAAGARSRSTAPSRAAWGSALTGTSWSRTRPSRRCSRAASRVRRTNFSSGRLRPRDGRPDLDARGRAHREGCGGLDGQGTGGAVGSTAR